MLCSPILRWLICFTLGLLLKGWSSVTNKMGGALSLTWVMLLRVAILGLL